jgi:hypothetical protein
MDKNLSKISYEKDIYSIVSMKNANINIITLIVTT